MREQGDNLQTGLAFTGLGTRVDQRETRVEERGLECRTKATEERIVAANEQALRPVCVGTQLVRVVLCNTGCQTGDRMGKLVQGLEREQLPYLSL